MQRFPVSRSRIYREGKGGEKESEARMERRGREGKGKMRRERERVGEGGDRTHVLHPTSRNSTSAAGMSFELLTATVGLSLHGSIRCV